MKLALCFGLLWLGAGWAGAQSPLSNLQRVPLYGYDYHRLDDWARANGFRLRWVVPDAQVRAVKGSSVLELVHNSRRMSVNGVDVWLSVPVVVRSGVAHVSALDFRTVIHPILFPVRNPVRQAVKTIVLDPGHGGDDPGNREGARQEKTYTLLLARELRA
ncbi:MAG TPA: N-acetylmuramoyl-L-alanine amidase, partial [Methylomirabilota bacterium]|nr:N-acetylmuramoyl-L-alanine amidase [Methylomirabilota bacterium]